MFEGLDAPAQVSDALRQQADRRTRPLPLEATNLATIRSSSAQDVRFQRRGSPHDLRQRVPPLMSLLDRPAPEACELAVRELPDSRHRAGQRSPPETIPARRAVSETAARTKNENGGDDAGGPAGGAADHAPGAARGLDEGSA